MERQFILDEMHVVLQSDALASTHAMQVPAVETPEDANAVFDNIAYNKGNGLIPIANLKKVIFTSRKTE
jgi:aminopeptidase N